MKILVTGGAGFVGSKLVERLANVHRVTVLDKYEYQVHGNSDLFIPHPIWKLAVEDLSNPTSEHVLDQLLEDIDVVIHLAAQVGVGQSMYQVTKYVQENCVGTARLLEGIQRHKDRIKKLIVASSMSIYGEGYETRGVDEMDLPMPTSVYAVTKRDQEELCLAVGNACSIQTTALRFFNIYGPGQALSNPYTGVIAIFASRLLNDKAPIIFDDGSQTRDFIHVDDIVQGIIKAMNAEVGGIFNLGTGRAVAIKEIAHILGLHLGKIIMPEYPGKKRKGDIKHCYANINRAREMFDFNPTVDLHTGLQEYAQWLRNQQAIDHVDRATEELIINGLLE